MIEKVQKLGSNGAGPMALLSVFCASAMVAQDLIALPSGLGVQVQDVIFEEDPAVSRFRFVAPDLGKAGSDYADVREDFFWLCDRMILPTLSDAQRTGEIVVSIADRPVVFGQITPEATQYFEMFRVANGTCIWEDF